MSRRVLFDSSAYVQALRERRVELLQSRTYDGAFVHLSAVVACELLAGAKNPRSRRELERLWSDFDRAGRLVVPVAEDWYDAGVVLSQIAAKYGHEQIGQARLVHDTIIALSARRHGISVVTLNRAHFDLVSEFRPVRILLPNETLS